MTSGYLSKKSIKAVLWVMVIGFIVELGGYFYGFQPSNVFYRYYSYEVDRLYLEANYGISIKNQIAESEYPEKWLDNEILKNQTYIPKIKNQYDNARLIRAFHEEFIKYNKLVIKKSIHTLYFVDSLKIKGTSIGGTYDLSSKSLYIPNKNGFTNKRYTRVFLKKVFHHELSSILMKSYNFNKVVWRAVHNDGFQYEKDKDPTYSWMFLNGYIEPVDVNSLLNKGLLNQYSETGVENDFNTYAEVVFTNPRRMKKLISEYPIIQRKYEVFKAFYLSIDEGFSPVFEKIDD